MRRDDALFHASLNIASNAFTGIGLALLGETPLQTHPLLLIINPLLGILCLGMAVYIERYLLITYEHH
jgi:hypothetical protein